MKRSTYVGLLVVIMLALALFSQRGFSIDMVRIPGGSFTQNENNNYGYPTRTVHVSAFSMGKYEVSYAEWTSVYNWAVGHGYEFANAGAGKAANHPVHTINWFDAVKWCNAKSEMDGLDPCYWNGSTVFRVGGYTNTFVPGFAFSANGYRLPTLAEWEYVAKSGRNGLYFPWGDRINQSLANYNTHCFLPNTPSYDCDDGPVCGWNPAYFTGEQPFTAPVHSFPATGYGLHNIVGNIDEWVWHWGTNGYSDANPATDPISVGITQEFPWDGETRMASKGGSWMDRATLLWIDFSGGWNPTTADYMKGFRVARNAANWDKDYVGLDGQWRWLNWFGFYSVLGNWINHQQHGYMGLSASSTKDSIYFYTADMGWLWTKSTRYPYIYRFSDGAWLWYNKGTKNPRWFNNLSRGTWEQH